MACKSIALVATSVDSNISSECYESGNIRSDRYSASASPDSFRPDLEAVSGSKNSRILQSRAGKDRSSSAGDDLKFVTARNSWYPQTNSCYTGYPAQTGTGNGAQTTCSGVTWPEVPTDDVKPTSFVLSAPPNECNANCRQSYCNKR